MILIKKISGKTILTSTFVPFPSTLEGIWEHLMALQKSSLSSELYNMIEDLECNKSGLAIDIANHSSIQMSDVELVDDFKGSHQF